MSAESVSDSLGAGASCWFCHERVSTEDRFCRFCGRGQGRCVPWYYHHWGILFLALVALGPFALILVWRSPLLNRTARWVYTAVFTAMTVYVGAQLYRAWVAFRSAWTLLQQGM